MLRLARGDLPEAAFRRYLVQDYLFLLHFARAWGLAVYKSDTLSEMRRAQSLVAATLDVEIGLHIEYCRRWGLSEAVMAAEPEALETVAYTRFVLDRGLAGDRLDLEVALAPCVIGYAEIARERMADSATKRDGNPYREWLDMYAGAEYQNLAREAARRSTSSSPGAAARAASRRWRLPSRPRPGSKPISGKWASRLPGTARHEQRAMSIAAALADIDLPGNPSDHRVVVAMSGGVEFVGCRGVAGARRVRCRRRHVAAL